MTTSGDSMNMTDFSLVSDGCSLQHLCKHRQRPAFYTSRSTKNPGRRFFRCSSGPEKARECLRGSSESGSEGASVCGDDNVAMMDDSLPSPTEKKQISLEHSLKNLVLLKNSLDVKLSKQPGTPKSKSQRPPQGTLTRRNMRMNSETRLLTMSPRVKRSSPGHVSDSELP